MDDEAWPPRPLPRVEDAELRERVLEVATEADGDQPHSYQAGELDLLAIYCTLVKTTFLRGELQACGELLCLIQQARRGKKDLHLTSVRNENAYFGCIKSLFPALPTTPAPEPGPDLVKNVVYVVGDSHCLPLAWQRITLGGETHTMVPLLVTGCKAWHLRPESSFYPKHNFRQAMRRVPRGATVIFLFGEIDCREGMLRAVEKCRYKDLSRCMQATVRIHLKALKDEVAAKSLKAFIHPVAPVLDETRSVVMQYNAMLPMFLGTKSDLRYLDFASQLLEEDGNALLPEYKLDGTHIHPSYVVLLQQAMDKVMSSGTSA